MSANTKIIIAGAGIGGLTAALALAEQGIATHVLERAGELSEVGAGIQISPNAARVLIGLGFESELEKTAVSPVSLVVRSGLTGVRLAAMAIRDAMPARFGAPYWVIHRADLLDALAKAARKDKRIALDLGCEVTGVSQTATGVSVAVAGGKPVTGRALIGADGVRSAVRAALGGPAPDFTGYIAWRGTIPANRMPAGLDATSTGLWLGPDAHLVHYPIRKGDLVNVVAIVSGAEIAPGWGEPAPADELDPYYRDWVEPARDLVGAVSSWLRWPLAAFPPLLHWSDGRVTLLGDAAHPTLPFLAQGGAMAIEDAAVIAQELARPGDDPAGAFARYEARRRQRTTRLQRGAARNGRIFHMAGPARIARDIALRLMPAERFAARQDWIYSWRP